MCYGYDGDAALNESLERKGASRRGLLRGAVAGAAGATVLAAGSPALAAKPGSHPGKGLGHAYGRNALADRQLTYRFTSDAIQGGIPEVQARFPWNSIRRIVVTPEHALLLVSRRDALILPRRIVETEEDFDTLLAFARARIAAARA